MLPNLTSFKILLAENKHKIIHYNPEKILHEVLTKLCFDREWKLEEYIAYKAANEVILDLNIPLKSLGTLEISFLPKPKKKNPVPAEVEKFHKLVAEGNTTAVTELLKTTDIDINCPGKIKQRTALHLASDNGHKQIVRFLLKHGAALTAVDELEWTALHCASVKGHLDVVEILISKGHSVTMVTTDGTSCLHYLVRNDFSPKLQKMIDAMIFSGADINAANKNGETPLHSAVSKMKPEVVYYLLRRGGSMLSRNKLDQTPQSAALLISNTQKRAEILKIFEDWKLNPYPIIEESRTPKPYKKEKDIDSPTSFSVPNLSGSLKCWKDFSNGYIHLTPQSDDSNDESDDDSLSGSDDNFDPNQTLTQEQLCRIDTIAKRTLTDGLSVIFQQLHRENTNVKNEVQNLMLQIGKAEIEIKKLKKKKDFN